MSSIVFLLSSKCTAENLSLALLETYYIPAVRFVQAWRSKQGFLHRKHWTAYVYIDMRGKYNEAFRIFFKNRVLHYPMRVKFLHSSEKYLLCVSRVHKEDAELFEACLYQLHTILSKEDGYEQAKEEMLAVIRNTSDNQERRTAVMNS